MKIKIWTYILLACYVAIFLRFFINNNFIVSIIGSLFFGFFIDKRLSYYQKKIFLNGFFSCFTSFSGFIFFLYQIFNQGDWIKSIILCNLIIIINLFVMHFGFWISRKIT
jgi:CrcB protein